MKVETPHNQNGTATHPSSVFAHHVALGNCKFVPLIHPRVCLSAPHPPPLWQPPVCSLRGTNFQLQHKQVMGMKCAVWNIVINQVVSLEGDNQQPDLSRWSFWNAQKCWNTVCVPGTNMGLQVNHTSKANVQTYRKEIYFVVTRSSVGREGVEGSQRYKLLVIRQIWTRDVRYSMVNIISIVVCYIRGFPRGSLWKNQPANAGDATDVSPVLGREDPWRRKWPPIQYSCLENPMDRGAWGATFHGVYIPWGHKESDTA